MKNTKNNKHSDHLIEFEISEVVYLKTDKEQRPRIISGIVLRPFNSVGYYLSLNEAETVHYGFEMTKEKDIVLHLSN